MSRETVPNGGGCAVTDRAYSVDSPTVGAVYDRPPGQSAQAGKFGTMTKLLEKAFAVAVKLPKKEQDRLAKWLLAELESERRWGEAFAGSTDQLARLAHEALKEHRKGRTKPLNPEQL